jgi:hypothetical protein
MYINKKSFLICIVIVILLVAGVQLAYNISRNQYIKSIVKSDSEEILANYTIYNDIDPILNKYLGSIKNNEYGKLNNMSVFYAKMSNGDYKNIKEKLSLEKDYTIDIEKVYMLDTDIYRCIFNVKSNDSSIKCTVCIKLDTINNYFKILDFMID